MPRFFLSIVQAIKNNERIGDILEALDRPYFLLSPIKTWNFVRRMSFSYFIFKSLRDGYVLCIYLGHREDASNVSELKVYIIKGM